MARMPKGKRVSGVKPLAIDLYCGLGGWAEGLLAEGFRVIGFDIERHDYGTGPYPAQLVIQDVLTLHGSQFKDAALIVASPPCQAYSYRAMPWKRAKALPPPDNSLFEACFRIQREAIRATGRECPDCDTGWPEGRMCLNCRGVGAINTRYIPLIVENVRGAQKWVGRAKWHFGSYYLWGDVPALMPITLSAAKVSGSRFDGSGRSFQTASVEAQKRNPDGTEHGPGSWFKIADSKNRGARSEAVKVPGISFNASKAVGFNVTAAQRYREGVKNEHGGSWYGNYQDAKAAGKLATGRGFSSKPDSRKAASAQIAKIPFPLSQHIARTFKYGASV